MAKLNHRKIIGRTALSIAMLGAIITSSIQAAEIKADSTIKGVTIYPSSAKVVRTATITLEAGDNDVIISNLPLSLNETSLRVSGEGQGNISLGSVELLKSFQEDVVQENEKSLLEEIEKQQEARRVIKDALTRSQNQLKYIQSMALGDTNPKPVPFTNSNQSAYKNLPLEKWKNAWQTLDVATAEVQEKIRMAEKSLRAYDKQINKLNRELKQIAVSQKETRVAKLHVKSELATELTLKLVYQIRGARWAPVYDADLDTQTGKVVLKTFAQISQRTGEDWKNVAVTLSTLRPSAGTQLPHLNPWVLDFMPDIPPPMMYQQKSVRRKSAPMMDKATMDESVETTSAMAAPMVAKKPMQQEQTQLISTDFSAEYKVPGVISLDSGSNKRRFALTSQNFNADVHLASAPRQDPRVMILAKIKHTDDSPLLAGNLSLYRNGSFVGNTYLQQKLSGEEIKLSFGEDDKVKIKFLPDPDKKRRDGLLFGKKKVVERHYQLVMKSNHDKPFDISIYDVIPVSANEDIKIKYLGDAPTKKDLEHKKGVVSWERKLAPKQDTKLQYGYSVSYPEDKLVPRL